MTRHDTGTASAVGRGTHCRIRFLSIYIVVYSERECVTLADRSLIGQEGGHIIVIVAVTAVILFSL